MIILEKPERIRVNDAWNKYYPNTFIMINCENMWEDPNYIGEVVAYAPLTKKGPLIDLVDQLVVEGHSGECCIVNTKDLLDGGSLLGEIYIAD